LVPGDLKRILPLVVCLIVAFLLFTIGCNGRNFDKEKTKETEITKNNAILTSQNHLLNMHSESPMEMAKQYKILIVDTILPVASEKNKAELKEISKYLDDVEKKPSDYFDDNNHIIELIQTTVRVIVILAEIEPDNFYVNYKAAVHCVSAGNMIGHLAQSDVQKQIGAEFKKKGVHASKDLVRKFPDEAKAYEQLAIALLIVEGDKKKALKLYKRCMELDPEFERCRNNYLDLREELNGANQ
jgi:tetratricopeptide (TPR) repeat protein